MLTALFADVHANREAFTACLADAERAGADQYVLLGDLVGYGPDPAWVVERAAEMVADGALAIQGNHDAAAVTDTDTMNPLARRAIEWTRTRLDAHHRRFLADLPLDLHEDDRLYVHASASAPEDWIYVLGPREAFHSFRATAQRVTFCGHTHIPALFNESATACRSTMCRSMARRCRCWRSDAGSQFWARSVNRAMTIRRPAMGCSTP